MRKKADEKRAVAATEKHHGSMAAVAVRRFSRRRWSVLDAIGRRCFRCDIDDGLAQSLVAFMASLGVVVSVSDGATRLRPESTASRRTVFSSTAPNRRATRRRGQRQQIVRTQQLRSVFGCRNRPSHRHTDTHTHTQSARAHTQTGTHKTQNAGKMPSASYRRHRVAATTYPLVGDERMRRFLSSLFINFDGTAVVVTAAMAVPGLVTTPTHSRFSFARRSAL